MERKGERLQQKKEERHRARAKAESEREQRWREYPVIDQSRQVVATAFL
jgi:hypothetical protein